MERDKILEALLEGQRIMMAELKSQRDELQNYPSEFHSFRDKTNSKLDVIREEVATAKEGVSQESHRFAG